MTAPASPSGSMRTAPGTLNQLFFDAVERHDRDNALQAKVNGVFRPISHRVLAERVRRAALGLRTLGVTRGARVALLSENRPEWAIADFACLTSGVTNVPLYPTLPPEQIAFILKDSGAVALFVSTAEQAAKIAEVRGELPGAAARDLVRGGAAAGRGTLARGARGARRGGGECRDARAVPRRRAVGAPRRPRDDHLHLGHHRRAEGRDALARQHHVERARGGEW